MQVSVEVLLMAAVIGLYLYDSALLLYSNEGVLTATRASRWRAALGFANMQILGKRIFIPNPLLPHCATFRLAWGVEGHESSHEETWPDLNCMFDPIAPLIWFMAIALFVLLPLGLFTRLGERMLLSALGVLYINIVTALFWLWRNRASCQLTGRQWLGLAFEALACSPLALNLVRKISARMTLREDFLHAAPRLLSAVDWNATRLEIVARLNEEIENEEDASERRTILELQRQALQQEIAPCLPPKSL
jgi:hypothetical protein